MKKINQILVITNDSTVFLNEGLSSAFDMFGGRVTEIKQLVARLDTASKDDAKMCSVSFGVITTFFGFVPGNYSIAPYSVVMSNKEQYELVQERKDYAGKIAYIASPFDKVIVCVPKDMFAILLREDALPEGKVIAVTSPEFKDECEKRGWMFLERKGARLGNENSERVFKAIEEMC